MAKYKILGGQLSDSAVLYSAILRNDVTGKVTNGGKLTAMSFMMGALTLEATTKWGNKMVVDTVPTLIQNVDEIVEVTEDNAVNFKGAAGWGIVGGLLTGGSVCWREQFLGDAGKLRPLPYALRTAPSSFAVGKAKTIQV